MPDSSNDQFKCLKIAYLGNYAIVTLQKEPVNTMTLQMWQELTRALDTLEANPKIRGLILQSGLRRDVFTAGNDILELYAPKTTRERYREFWLTSNRFLARLYISRLVTIAAIKGACPAGGCCMSMCCDYRLMTDSGTIGLNEVALGISVPKYWGQLMQNIVGKGPADKLLQFAVLLNPVEAKDLGLIDEVVPVYKLLAAAEAAMSELLKAPDVGRAETKRLLRGEFVEQWMEYAKGEADYAWDLLSAPEVVKKLAGVMERLSSGKKKNDVALRSKM